AKSSNTSDKFIVDAATAAAANNGKHFLIALASRKEANTATLNTAAIVAQHYARGGTADSVGALIAKLAHADLNIAEPIVRGLATGWTGKAQPQLDASLDKNLAKLASRLNAE